MEVGSLNIEDGTPYKSELDLNSHENKDEERTQCFQDNNKEAEEMQGYDDQERSPVLPIHVDRDEPQERSPVLPVHVDREEPQSILANNSRTSPAPIEEPNEHLPVDSDLVDNAENKSLSNSTEELGASVEDHKCHDEKDEDTYDILSNDLDAGSDKLTEDENILKDTDSCIGVPVLTVDSNAPVLTVDNETDASEKSKFNDGTQHGAFSNDMEINEDDHTLLKEEGHTIRKEDGHVIAGANFDARKTLEEYSVGHSLPAHKGTPSPEMDLSAPMERSPDNNKPSSVEDQPLTEVSEIKSASSPTHISYTEKLAVGHKRPRDSSSPPGRHKSPPRKMTHQDVHGRESSPRRNISASPRRRESPRRRVSPRRRDRSKSRSPVRRKDASGHRRDHRGRSRSRSPHARDHYRRSPRRRHSPGRRSPPPSYHSRPSPRRPWSPPTNRNTGVGRPGRNLFVAGFSYVTTERDLEKKFSRFGRVTDVRIVRDRRSGDSRGFGFLSLEKDEDADAAIRALDQTEWNGRIVLVEKSKTSAR